MNKLEQAAREVVRQHSMECLSDKAVDSLREALAEQAEGAIVKTCPDGYGTITTEQAEQEPLMITPGGGAFPFAVVGELEQAEQEPVGEVVMESMGVGDAQIVRFRMNGRIPPVGTKLYAAPVRTKDLTDEEIEDAVGWTMTEQSILDCRAVIAADRKKNR